MHAHANTLNNHFHPSPSTSQYTAVSKGLSPNDDHPTHMRTVTPKETPPKISGPLDLSAAFLEKRSRIRGTKSCLYVINAF